MHEAFTPSSPVPIEDLVVAPGVDHYAVFGNPVAHSLSPRIHAQFARQTGDRLVYQAVLVPVAGFAAALDRFQDLGGRGLNVTLPFKSEACGLAGTLSARARHCGSVNTIWFDGEGRRHGETTDGLGLVRDFARLGIGVTGQRVLVLGAGGAVAGVLPDLLAAAPARLVVANRTLARAEALVSLLGGGEHVAASTFPALAGGQFDLVINGTSVGLSGTVPPLPPRLLAPGAACYDMVYGAGARPFCAWARDGGARLVSDGLGMLVEQAAESFFLWRGRRPETGPVLAALASAG